MPTTRVRGRPDLINLQDIWQALETVKLDTRAQFVDDGPVPLKSRLPRYMCVSILFQRCWLTSANCLILGVPFFDFSLSFLTLQSIYSFLSMWMGDWRILVPHIPQNSTSNSGILSLCT